MKLRNFLLILVVFYLRLLSNAQEDHRFINFNLIYFHENSQLSHSQQSSLNAYLEALKGQQIKEVFIDISMSKSKHTIGVARVNDLKAQFSKALGIPTEKINTLDQEYYHYDFLHHLSEDFDALKIMVSYTNITNKPLEYIPYSEEIMYKEQGWVSSGSKSIESCEKDTLIKLASGVYLKLNMCDYNHFKQSLTFNYIYGNEISALQNVQHVHEDGSHVLNVINISFGHDEELCFPAEFIIDKADCIQKYELTPILLTRSGKMVIPLNCLYDKSKNDIISFSVKPQGGTYLLTYKKLGEDFTITFKFPKSFTIESARLNTKCADIYYNITPLKNNTFSSSFMSFDFEPSLTVIATNKYGVKHLMNNVSISRLKGSKKNKELLFLESDSKTESKKTLFKTYKISSVFFNPVK